MRIFIRIIFVSFLFIQIYSDISLYRFLDTNLFGYSFIPKSIRMSHSVLNPSQHSLTFINPLIHIHTILWSALDWGVGGDPWIDLVGPGLGWTGEFH